ncbi:putative uncharacterized alpha/beta hydrolase domain (DUF2235) [Lyophyllum shimeji]|uniref:Uncharacterized alpha/beta hydrolase domain (DUF2235) n=1 Tax=Lyophyllum shimeji TaxID=47721 RepID=A0A9P3PT13_LYOSH|nr:putative uncharacterized alpha/beta hydrolase domain (DUF2235) [Lyophyllum shimeji]
MSLQTEEPESTAHAGGKAANDTLNGVDSLPPASLTGSVPPEHLNRTLVLCFDGTGDQFDSDNSNIVQLFAMLKKDDRDQQLCYYQAGIGTYTTPKIATPMMAKISKTLDEAIAWNLDAHVMDGYEFLMQNYKAGDRICIFGFSRGAYTARALAGMIHKVGLLPACNHQQVPFAYKMYTKADELGWKQSNAFKKAFSVDVKIEFIGVWDTVNAVGLIPRRLPFTTSNTIVRTFRHAVALDERRARFKPNHWNRPTDKEAALGISAQKPVDVGARPKPVKKHTLKAMERQFSAREDLPTDIEEVWFAGCHCDVGGGSVDNGTPHTLARISLRWMVRECFKTQTGILFMADGLRDIGLDPASLYPVVQPRPSALPVEQSLIQRIPKKQPAAASYPDGYQPISSESLKTEEEHELRDALAPIYDQLELVWWFWWILEVLPQTQRYQLANKKWEKKFKWNLGEGRYIPRQKKGVVKVHRSVKMRMEAEYPDGTKYRPKASFERAAELGNLVWVD